MSRPTPAEAIVQFLSFAGDPHNHVELVAQLKPRAWQRVLRRLDDVGLSFYFLRRLEDCNATGAIPASALSRLQQNFASNQCRVEDMARRFDLINKKFNDAGIHYAVMKGFSLVPQFCPDASLRHQGDFDYLIDDKSFEAAHRVLVEAGYIMKDSSSSLETVFVIPGGLPSRSGEQYSPRAPHAVELHTDMWDADLHRLPRIPKLFFPDRAIPYHWNGLTFPALRDEDAFLLQVLHTSNELFTFWIRMSCLFEIGYFLNCRAYDAEFWNRTGQRVADNPVLREFVVIVTELARKLFSSPVPPVIHAWGAKIRPASRVWIEHYARRCVFSELPAYQFSLFPTAKFALFLQRQFNDEAVEGKNVVRKRLLSSSRLSRIILSIKQKPSLAMNANWWKHQRLIQRSMFHILAGARYVWEIPRWRWLNRTHAPSSPS